MFKITLKCGNDEVEINGFAGSTRPRDLQILASKIWGNGAVFSVSAPAIGLFSNEVARA